jgi:hypothetical protein
MVMNNNALIRLADEFANELHKIAGNEHAIISDKLAKIVRDLYPFVADNVLHEEGDHYQLTIELMTTPDYTSDTQKTISDEELEALIDKTVAILVDNFPIVDMAIRDTTDTYANGGEGKIMAITVKIPRKQDSRYDMN